MATPTYVALATTTLTSAAASITFSSISSSYRDIVAVLNAPSAGGAQRMYFNGDTSNVTMVAMYGYPPNSTGSYTDTGIYDTTGTTGTRLGIFHIMDYSASNHKTVLYRYEFNAVTTMAAAARWASTAAITSIVFDKPFGGSYPVGTTISLYGIEA